MTDPELFAKTEKMPEKYARLNGYNKSYNTFVKEMGWGKGLDIHKQIGKLPNQKVDGHYRVINTLAPKTISKTK